MASLRRRLRYAPGRESIGALMEENGSANRVRGIGIGKQFSCGHLTLLAVSEVRRERTARTFRTPDLVVIQRRIRELLTPVSGMAMFRPDACRLEVPLDGLI